MIKILIFGLILIASESAYSGGKEYTYKICDEGKNNCNECEDKGDKISFKVSKSLASVMRTVIKKDGTKRSSTMDNCKIFDEDTFDCETEKERILLSHHLILSNGEWHYRSSLGEHNSHSCGTEIKSVFNLFK
jgi:hypothetical protein